LEQKKEQEEIALRGEKLLARTVRCFFAEKYQQPALLKISDLQKKNKSV
jgi:hypothetical protein